MMMMMNAIIVIVLSTFLLSRGCQTDGMNEH